eukprot:409467_1
MMGVPSDQFMMYGEKGMMDIPEYMYSDKMVHPRDNRYAKYPMSDRGMGMPSEFMQGRDSMYDSKYIYNERNTMPPSFNGQKGMDQDYHHYEDSMHGQYNRYRSEPPQRPVSVFKKYETNIP